MIDRRPFYVRDPTSGNPDLVGYKTSIECGCCVIVGLRTDNHEPATAACPCSAAHKPVMAEFNRRMAASLDHPLDLELIEVCNTILEQIDVAAFAATDA